jgi:adenosylhomocysteine/aminodeoxyfutalosine nucleosidase
MVSGERLLLIAAEPREFSGLLKFCTNVKRLGWPVHWARAAALNGREVLLVANGAGGIRAAHAVEVASSDGKLDRICSMGFCGALENGIQVGDIFVAKRVDGGGVRYAASTPQSGQMRHRTGVLASIDRVAQTAQEKCELRAGGASAVDMEAAGVAQKAAALNLPFFCVRSVTDLAEESFHFDLNSALRSDGRFDTMRLIAATCRRPLSLLPELVRLGGRCRTASQTLGEFIASCRF